MIFTEEEIRLANNTARAKGASSFNKDGTVRSVTVNYVLNNIDKNKSILDFGSGKIPTGSIALKNKGFQNVTSYDFGKNCIEGIHEKNALRKQYDIVFASNVINVASSENMLKETLLEMFNAVKSDGELILNYPESPRKLNLNTTEMRQFIIKVLNKEPQYISKNLWKIIK